MPRKDKRIDQLTPSEIPLVGTDLLAVYTANGTRHNTVNSITNLIKSNTYTTGATLNGTILEFDRNDSLNAYNVDLTPFLGGVIYTTHEELLIMSTENDLTIGQIYAIDHTTVHRVGVSEEINTGETETILLTAISTNSFNSRVSSIQYPNDEILYSINTTKIYDPLTELVDFDVNGFITYRKDNKGNEGHYDIRNYVVEVWPRYDDVNGNTYLNQSVGGLRHGYTFGGITSTKIRIEFSGSTYDGTGILQIGSETYDNLTLSGTSAEDVRDELSNQLTSGPNDIAYISHVNGSYSFPLTFISSSTPKYLDIVVSSDIDVVWTENTDLSVVIHNREVLKSIDVGCVDCGISKSTRSAEEFIGSGFTEVLVYPNNIILANSLNCSIGKNSEDCIITSNSRNCTIGNECFDINITPNSINQTGRVMILEEGDTYETNVFSQSLQIGNNCSFIDVFGIHSVFGPNCSNFSSPIPHIFLNDNKGVVNSEFAAGTTNVTIRKSVDVRWLNTSEWFDDCGTIVGLVPANEPDDEGNGVSFSNTNPAYKIAMNWAGQYHRRAVSQVPYNPSFQISKVLVPELDILRFQQSSYYMGGIRYWIYIKPQGVAYEDDDFRLINQETSGDGELGGFLSPPNPMPYLWPDKYDSDYITINFNNVDYSSINDTEPNNNRIIIDGVSIWGDNRSDDLSFEGRIDALTSASSFQAVLDSELNTGDNNYLGYFPSENLGNGIVRFFRVNDYNQKEDYKKIIFNGNGKDFLNLNWSRGSYSDNGPWYFTSYLTVSFIRGRLNTMFGYTGDDVIFRIGVFPIGWESGKTQGPLWNGPIKLSSTVNWTL